ncbi:hypothetical protein [Methylobacterium sp. E-045]|uniref:hypothetical protein n=1 Tax=Methylobacterium sp. E-045 TaxID=2836575 RepID=UPI001FBA9A72|nr:hypothetical protein [Methylobacterium sp. E-045]MCJ2132214.1 hypothetical protein [Methylobacterium sp. E-045]
MARRKTIADAEAAEVARFLDGATDVGPLDPVDAAIATHRAAWAKMLTLYEAKKTAKPRYKAEYALQDYKDVYSEHVDEFVRTLLTTMAQVTAFASYIAEFSGTFMPWDCPSSARGWQLSAAMANVADALVRLSAAAPAITTARAPLALAA